MPLARSRHASLVSLLPFALLTACDTSSEVIDHVDHHAHELETSAQDEMLLPAATIVHEIPGPLGPSANGQYTESGTHYNDAPVYTKGTFSLYRRLDGKWYVDANAISENIDGTLANTLQAQDLPWSLGPWSAGVTVFRTVTVSVYGIPYASLGSNGDYAFQGMIYNKAPVYQRVTPGYTWSLYKRANGKWHVDFNDVSEDWSGTVAYTDDAQDRPWSATWHNGEVSFRTARPTLADVVYASYGSVGEYEFTGQIYNDAPVYARTGADTTWSLYRRANGNWHVDFNDVSEDWSGTVAYTDVAMDAPWASPDWHNDELVNDPFLP